MVKMVLNDDLMGGQIECSSDTNYQIIFQSNDYIGNTINYMIYASKSNAYIASNSSDSSGSSTISGNLCGTYCVYLVDSASYIDSHFIDLIPYTAFQSNYRALMIEHSEE